VKLSYEALQQRQEEEWTELSSTPPRDTGRAMSEWLRESQEATKELLKLKDRLIEVERNVRAYIIYTRGTQQAARGPHPARGRLFCGPRHACFFIFYFIFFKCFLFFLKYIFINPQGEISSLHLTHP